MSGQDHEIKGSAFVTLLRWASVERPGAVPAFFDALPPTDREPVRGALPSTYHPEALHQRVLGAAFTTFAAGDLDAYEAMIGACTLLGVQTFARLVLGFTSPAFLVRRLPALWGVLRRGPATLTVEQVGPTSVLRYREFPFFGDRLYRHYFRALLGAVVTPTLGHAPVVELLGHGADWLDVEIALSRG